jgi:2-octaprenylphenol hydroxylase
MSEPSHQTHYDVIIVGGGVVGALVTCGLAQVGLRVALLEHSHGPAVPSGEFALRVSSINLASARILQALKVWNLLDLKRLAPFHTMKVWDSLGRGEISFDSLAIGESCLGWILENEHLNAAIWQKLATLSTAHCLTGIEPLTIDVTEKLIKLNYSHNGTTQTLNAALLLAADGQRSWVREQLAISVSHKSYDQSAIVANLQCQHPHQDTARQVFLKTGPLALLPLADTHQVALVWSTGTKQSQELIDLDDEAFAAQIGIRVEHVLGKIKLISKRLAIPLIRQEVRHYIQPRIALLGDAAHTIHPLAGQGLNLGIRDVAILLELVKGAHHAGHDIGGRRVLRRLERRTKPHNLHMAWVMDGFHMGFCSKSAIGVALRNLGMRSLDRVSAKHHFVRFACGLAGDLPELASYNPELGWSRIPDGLS